MLHVIVASVTKPQSVQAPHETQHSHGDSPGFAQGLLSAIHFAALKHSRQRRKGADASPYINHPITVAELLTRVAGVNDLLTLQAAILHDTLEDTETTAAELDRSFGTGVRRLVEELTDDKALPGPQRKQLQVEHAPHLSFAAKLIKLADKTANVTDINEIDPVGWPLERKRAYLQWAGKVVAGVRGINPALEELFDKIVAEKRALLSKL